MASQDRAATFAVVAKDAASAVLRGVGKEMGKLGKTGGAVFKALAVTVAAVSAAISLAAAATAKFAKMAITAAIADDAEQQQLIATLKTRGLTTEEATKRTNELIAAGAKLAFTDSEVRAGLGVTSQYAKKYTTQQKIMTAAMNISRAKHISLEAAAKLVGKAFKGQGSALAAMGVDLKRTTYSTTEKIKTDKYGIETIDKTTKATKALLKGQKALNAINKPFGGIALAYASTFSGAFEIVKNTVKETVESIGMAIGGGQGLPVFTKLLKGIQPVVDDLLGAIQDSLPDISRFSDELVTKFLKNLPGYVRTAKRELPILIDKVKSFISSAADLGKKIVEFLGPDGLVTGAIAGIGAKFGGISGALGTTFSAQFIKMGIDPVTAMLAGTVTGSLAWGVAEGLTKAMAGAAVTKFLGLFKNIPVSIGTPTVPVPGGGVPAVVPGVTGGPGMVATATATAGGAAAIVAVAGAALAAAGIVYGAKILYDALYSPAEQERNMIANYAKLQARIKSEGLSSVSTSANGVYSSAAPSFSSDYMKINNVQLTIGSGTVDKLTYAVNRNLAKTSTQLPRVAPGNNFHP